MRDWAGVVDVDVVCSRRWSAGECNRAVQNRKGGTRSLGDIAYINFYGSNRSHWARQSKCNCRTIAREVVNRIKLKVAEINEGKLLPEGLQIVPFYDRTDLVNAAMFNVAKVLIEGVILVIILLFLFWWLFWAIFFCFWCIFHFLFWLFNFDLKRRR